MTMLCNAMAMSGGAPKFLGLVAWYDFTQTQYLTLSSTAITQALDRSGNGNHTAVQGTSTKRPTFTASQLNGLSCATFDGGDTLALPSALYSVGASANTIFIVANRTTEAGTAAYPLNMSIAGTQAYYLRFNTTAGEVLFLNVAAGSGAAVKTGNTNTNYQILMGRRSGTTQAVAVNNGAETTNTSATNVTADAAYIGSLNDTSSYLTGGIAEILIYNRSLSTAEITQVNNYLANKYGIWVSGAGWIDFYSSWQQMLINAWQINKDNAFTNTTANPFATIYDPSVAALGSTTSLADTGRGVNTATEATNPPVNTAAAMGTANGLLYNATTTILNAGSDSTIDNIFAAGGCFIGVIKPTTIGEGSAGRVFDKAQVLSNMLDASGGACTLRLIKSFDTTSGVWVTTNRVVTLAANNIVAITYSSASDTNAPTMYANSLTAKAVTTTTAAVGTAVTDASSSLILGNNLATTLTFDGYIGKMVFLKSVPTTAQLTAVFNFLATEYGVTLT